MKGNVWARAEMVEQGTDVRDPHPDTAQQGACGLAAGNTCQAAERAPSELSDLEL